MKNLYYTVLVLLALPLCVSCSRTIADSYKAQETDNIWEALLSVVIPSAIPRGYTRASYVSLDGRDPSPTLIQRMRRLNIRIEKMSLSPVPYSQSNRGPGTEQRWKIHMLAIGSIEWLSPSHVRVYCERPGEGIRYTLVQKNGKWTVTSQQMEWVQ